MSEIKIGLNIFTETVEGNEKAFRAATDNGELIDFAVCHVEGQTLTKPAAAALAKAMDEYFTARGLEFITNFEYANWTQDCTAPDGTPWSDDSEGCHRVALPDEFLAELTKSKAFAGIMYDELEHIVLNRNPTIQISTKLKKILPVFPTAKTRDPLKQGETLTRQLTDYAQSFFRRGVPAMLGEHVYPVLFHKLAESGITPNFKSMKENLSNVAFATAAGAALQYGLPLYNCADNWFMLTNPGHSADELYHNLAFAYYAGADRVYTESVHVLADPEGNLTEHGRAFRRFCEEYHGKQRAYGSADYRPEIGVIHYDDGFWGQWFPVIFKKCLLANPKIKPDYRSRELFRIFNIITHGETCKNGISWGRFSPWSLTKKHFSFVSMNSTAVFDEKADAKVLDSLKLCFLCGIHIPEKTIAAVRRAVRENGLTVVTPKRFVPAALIKDLRGGITEVPDGKGRWLVIRSYRSRGLKKRLRGFLGNKGEMRLTFTTGETVLKITDGGNGFIRIR